MSMDADNIDDDSNWIDRDDEAWTPGKALQPGVCEHCSDPYEKDDPILTPIVRGEPMHRGCWDLHIGFQDAMAKDD